MGKNKKKIVPKLGGGAASMEHRISWKYELPVLSVLMVGTFLLRVLGQLNKVFVSGAVVFRETDPWYHMRLADSVVANFPRVPMFDQYLIFPQGSQVGFYPLLSWVVGFSGWLGMDYERVGAFLPPIFGSLLLVPLFFLVRKLVGVGPAFFACLLVAVLPTELFHRSLLGFTDHHVLEVFFMVLTLVFLVYALGSKHLKFSILAGVALGLYYLSWHGNLFFVFILGVWFLVQFLLSYYKKEPIAHLCKVTSIMFLVGAVMLIPYLLAKGAPVVYSLLAFGVALVPVGAYFFSTYIKQREAFLLSLIGLLLGGFFVVSVLYPTILTFGMESFRAIFAGLGSPISEVHSPTPSVLANTYGVAFLAALGGLFLYAWRRGSVLIIVWSVFILTAAMGQRKWGYYFTVDVAIMAAYLVWEISKLVKREVRGAAILVMCLFLVVPSLKGTVGMASLPNNITPEWYRSLTWLRENTPEPFTQDTYYGLDVREEPSYGVLTWWDYGHWIIRIGRRVPTSNPANWGSVGLFRFFPAQSVKEAEDWIVGYKIRYVIVDSEILRGKWPAVADVAGLQGDIYATLENSMAYKLFYGAVEGYPLVYQERGVKIFERTNWDN